MVVRMARGFARLEFPSTYTMLRDSLELMCGKRTSNRATRSQSHSTMPNGKQLPSVSNCTRWICGVFFSLMACSIWLFQAWRSQYPGPRGKGADFAQWLQTETCENGLQQRGCMPGQIRGPALA